MANIQTHFTFLFIYYYYYLNKVALITLSSLHKRSKAIKIVENLVARQPCPPSPSTHSLFQQIIHLKQENLVGTKATPSTNHKSRSWLLGFFLAKNEHSKPYYFVSHPIHSSTSCILTNFIPMKTKILTY